MFIRRNIPCRTAITYQLSNSTMFALETPITCNGNASRIPRPVAEVHLATQAETFQVSHERLYQQNKHHIMQVLKQHGIRVEAKNKL